MAAQVKCITLREIAPGLPIPLELPLGRIITVRSLMQQYLGNTEV